MHSQIVPLPQRGLTDYAPYLCVTLGGSHDDKKISNDRDSLTPDSKRVFSKK